MTIKTVAGLNQTLKNYSANDWRKSADIEFNKSFTLKDAPGVPYENGEVQQTFADFLKNSLDKVNTLQHDANQAIQDLASGKSSNIHETLLKAEEADIAFRMMNQVRGKVIDAYKEIMRMQI